MAWREIFRIPIVVALCVVLAVPAFPQSGNFNVGPSKAQVVGAVVGASAVIGVGGYLIYRAAHKHSLIQGCVTSDENGLTLRNEKDKKAYALAGDSGALKSGQRVAVSGKKAKDSSGRLTFQVQKLSKDLGACSPAA